QALDTFQALTTRQTAKLVGPPQRPPLIITPSDGGLAFGLRRQTDARQVRGFKVSAAGDGPGSIRHDGQPWLSLSRADFAGEGETEIEASLDPTQLSG